ncbi:MAG: alpha-amylase family glycosyl hydrolase [Desulfobacterales bacterium]|nr:alpha-amylase family glycosyl hydrolase [Desulfobacterales bacterium]
MRQFGAEQVRSEGRCRRPARSASRLLDAARYTVIPPSGTFRDLIAELDFIVGELGCRILMLLPIHPTPDHLRPHGPVRQPVCRLELPERRPGPGRFRPQGDADRAVRRAGGRRPPPQRPGLPRHRHQPHRLGRQPAHQPPGMARRAPPRAASRCPGAWGVQWEDLTKLDYRHRELWQFMAEVFLTWCRRGVDGFRCDAGYMVPHAAWKYIVARVREQFPDTTFLLEGLGGKISVTRQLLNTANLNWAYSELFQNYDRSQIEHYLPEAIDISATDGLTVHFAETHDNLRLAATLPRLCPHAHRAVRPRLPSGRLRVRQRGGVARRREDQRARGRAPELGRAGQPGGGDPPPDAAAQAAPGLSRPDGGDASIEQGGGNQLVILRRHRPTGQAAARARQPRPRPGRRTAAWNPEAAGLRQRTYTDLLTGRAGRRCESPAGCSPARWRPARCSASARTRPTSTLLQAAPADPFAVPPRVEHQRLRAKALQVVTFYRGTQDIGDVDPDRAAARAEQRPGRLLRRSSTRAGAGTPGRHLAVAAGPRGARS